MELVGPLFAAVPFIVLFGILYLLGSTHAAVRRIEARMDELAGATHVVDRSSSSN